MVDSENKANLATFGPNARSYLTWKQRNRLQKGRKRLRLRAGAERRTLLLSRLHEDGRPESSVLPGSPDGN